MTTAITVNKVWYQVSTNNVTWSLLLSSQIVSNIIGLDNVKLSNNIDNQYLYRHCMDLKLQLLKQLCYYTCSKNNNNIAITTTTSIPLMKRAVQYLNDEIQKQWMKEVIPSFKVQLYVSSSSSTCVISTDDDIDLLFKSVVFGESQSRVISNTFEGILFSTYHIHATFSIYNPTSLNFIFVNSNMDLMFSWVNQGNEPLPPPPQPGGVYTVNAQLHNLENSSIENFNLLTFVSNDPDRELMNENELKVEVRDGPVILVMNIQSFQRAAQLLGLDHWYSLLYFVILCSDKHTGNEYEEPDEEFSAERVSLISERGQIESRVRKCQLTNEFKHCRQLLYRRDSSAWMLQQQQTEDPHKYEELMHLAENIDEISPAVARSGISEMFQFISFNLTVCVVVKSLVTQRRVKISCHIYGYGTEHHVSQFEPCVAINRYAIGLNNSTDRNNIVILKKELEGLRSRLECRNLSVLDLIDFVFACFGIGQWFERRNDNDQWVEYTLSLQGLKEWTHSAYFV